VEREFEYPACAVEAENPMSESIEIAFITPLHEPRLDRLLQELTDDMKENGWRGRPLLVIEHAEDYLAWTGSHRIAAAEIAGLTSIPCYVLPESKLIAHGYDAERGHVEDYERLAILKKVGDEIALHLMWQENRS
jgi:ParB-like chromosome segregation protein Spo0J